jgi:xanthine dehydrogenase iron-sulfur cluster and FAD-binding subunit A
LSAIVANPTRPPLDPGVRFRHDEPQAPGWSFIQPTSWDEALAAKAAYPASVSLAGGTDVMVDLNFDRERPEALLDLTRVSELRDWTHENGRVHVGAGWMRAAGMAARTDAIGNVIARLEGADPCALALVLGSHFDTSPDAGRYDGALGVLGGIATVERLRAGGVRLPFAPLARFVEAVASRSEGAG